VLNDKVGSDWNERNGPVCQILPVKDKELVVYWDKKKFCEKSLDPWRDPFEEGWQWRAEVMKVDGWRDRIEAKRRLCERVTIQGWDGKSENVGCSVLRYSGRGCTDVSIAIFLCEKSLAKFNEANRVCESVRAARALRVGLADSEEAELRAGLKGMGSCLGRFLNGTVEGVLGDGWDILRRYWKGGRRA
jgi:hypothetical protein